MSFDPSAGSQRHRARIEDPRLRSEDLPTDSIRNEGSTAEGPAGGGFGGSLQYPLNVEGPEESHWIMFTPKKLISEPIMSQPSRTGDLVGVGTGGTKSIGEKIGSSLGKAASKAVTGVALNAVNKFIPGEVVEAAGIIKGLLAGGSTTTKQYSAKSITLYTPQVQVEDYRPGWVGGELGTLGAVFMAEVAAGKDGIGLDAVTGSLKQMIKIGKEALSDSPNSTWERIAGAIAGGALNQGNIGAAALREINQAVNPHLEAFFKNVDFRRFSFTFKFAPRSRKEAETVDAIIRSFKWHSAPGLGQAAEAGHYFTYPNVFSIAYSKDIKTHKFSDCACTGISVNRTASGTNSTFYDGYPVETDLTLTFLELEVMTRESFQRGY